MDTTRMPLPVTNTSGIVETTLLSSTDPRYSFRYFGLAIGFWTMLVGTIGNTLTVLVYVFNKKLQTTFNLLLLNLAAVDFCSSILMLPFHVAGYVQLKWPFGNDSFTTRLQAFNYFCCGYTSIVFLVVITINRFIGATFPGRYKEMFSQQRMTWLLIFSWTFAPILLLPFLIGTDPSCVNNAANAFTGFLQSQLLCTFVCLPPGVWESYMQFTRVLFQFIPLILMIAIYAFIFATVHGKRQEMNERMTQIFRKKHKKGQYADENDVSQGANRGKKSRSESVQRKKRGKEDTRMLIISVAICVGFMVCFLPSVIVNLLPKAIRYSIDIRWHMAASNLAWLNSSLNPLIYVVLNRRYRQEYWRILRIAVGALREKFVRDTDVSTSEMRPGDTTAVKA